MGKIAAKLSKAVSKLKGKKMATATVTVSSDKGFKVLQEGNHEIRIYSPAKRTIINQGDGFLFLQMPYMVFGVQPYGGGAFLYGCFATEDLSQMTPEERDKATVYRMPFPKQFDNGMWGPCCLNWSNCYLQPGADIDKLIWLFWMTEFRGLGDYSQKRINCWSDMSVEDVFKMLEKSPSFWKGTFKQFKEAVHAR